MTRGFLKHQLSVRTGSTIPQIESGVFLGKTNCKDDSMTKAQDCYIFDFSNDSFKCEDYFAKTADSNQITKPCDIKREGWGLDLQRLDGTKMSIHVEYCEVSIYFQLIAMCIAAIHSTIINCIYTLI